jgi:hypothetical protein
MTKVIKIIVGQFVISDLVLRFRGELNWKTPRKIIRVQNILGYYLPCDSGLLASFCGSTESRLPDKRMTDRLAKGAEEHRVFGEKKLLS